MLLWNSENIKFNSESTLITKRRQLTQLFMLHFTPNKKFFYNYTNVITYLQQIHISKSLLLLLF